MSDFIAITYRQSERFNLKLIEEDGRYVQVWSPRDVISGTSEKIRFGIFRVIASITAEEYEFGNPKMILILEVEDYEKFRTEASQSPVTCRWEIVRLDEEALIAFRSFCEHCIPPILSGYK